MASSHPSKEGSTTAAGDSMPLGTNLLDKGAEFLQGVTQNMQPIKRIHQHLCAFEGLVVLRRQGFFKERMYSLSDLRVFSAPLKDLAACPEGAVGYPSVKHVYAHDLSRQVEAHHFCAHLNEDMNQCLIYDTDEKNARLIGVEYVITDKIFATLEPEEKKMWHSHEYEVKSGTLVLPGVPKVAEKAVLKQLAKTYGKTWHFWQFDRGDTLPLGLPELMGAVTEDGQLDPKLVELRDKKYGISTAKLREERQDIEGPEKIDPLADFYRTGKGLQVEALREEEVQLPRHL